ncbi:MAG: hypothetical protein J2P30_08670 [Actinobacteria bacterium]|nr:hypothetical protein [Actinomycetota bacterium]
MRPRACEHAQMPEVFGLIVRARVLLDEFEKATLAETDLFARLAAACGGGKH